MFSTPSNSDSESFIRIITPPSDYKNDPYTNSEIKNELEMSSEEEPEEVYSAFDETYESLDKLTITQLQRLIVDRGLEPLLSRTNKPVLIRYLLDGKNSSAKELSKSQTLNRVLSAGFDIEKVSPCFLQAVQKKYIEFYGPNCLKKIVKFFTQRYCYF